MGTVIRAYRSADQAAVVALALRAWDPVFASLRAVLGDELDERMHGTDWREYQRKSVAATLADDDVHVWVAEDDGIAVAFMSVRLHSAAAMGELWMIAVDPAAQGRGVGAHLTSFATDWMRDAGMRVAMIATGGDAAHAPARHLYEKAGYTALSSVQYFKAL